MPKYNELDKRMKVYEKASETYLTRRVPVILRIDGKAFHSFTRGFKRPFDEVFSAAMARTMEYMCKNIQGCIFGYKQSDEISLVLVDYRKLNSDAWFDYRKGKMISISASMATVAFNKFFAEEVSKFGQAHATITGRMDTAENQALYEAYKRSMESGAMFDSRCENYPKDEVVNYVYWRQTDASRNSIQMVGQANFSHSELQDKSNSDIQDMLHEQKGINWNDTPTMWKRGVCWTRERGVDYEMPILRGEDRKYLEDLVYYQEES